MGKQEPCRPLSVERKLGSVCLQSFFSSLETENYIVGILVREGNQILI